VGGISPKSVEKESLQRKQTERKISSKGPSGGSDKEENPDVRLRISHEETNSSDEKEKGQEIKPDQTRSPVKKRGSICKQNGKLKQAKGKARTNGEK